MRLRAVPLAVVACYAVLGLTWSITNPPFAAPDETQHYLRALGVSQGTLIGDPTYYNGPQLSPKETAWRVKLTRSVPVPAGLSPTGLDCEVFKRNVTPNCGAGVQPNSTKIQEQTDVGRYPPFPYLLPAIVVSQPDNAPAANRLGRLVMLLLWVGMLAWAASILWDPRPGGFSLVGLVVALTPSAVFVGSILSDSGLELIGSVAFFAALMRLGRPAPSGRGVWALAATGGTVLALSRTVGPVWLVSELAIAVVLVGQRQVRHVLRSSLRSAIATGVILTLSLVLSMAWQIAYGPNAKVTIVPPLSLFHDGLWQLRGAFAGLFGWFGYDDVRLSTVWIAGWASMAGLVLGAAFSLGRRAERITLAVALAICFFVPLYLYAAVTNYQGIQTQGRHLLPLLVVVPLLSGEILRRHAERLAGFAVAPAAIGGLAITIQVVAWWVNSRRYAVGADGPLWFVSNPDWSPPAGWTLWVIVVGGVALAALGLSGLSIRPIRKLRESDVPLSA